MEIEYILMIAGVAVFIGYFLMQQKSSDSDLIQDDDVTTSDVLKKLEEFVPQEVANRKNGFTENDISKQLEHYLKTIYQHVTTQYGIGGVNVKAIDFDIGRGRVGIELKIASEAIREGNNDRLIGQVTKYKSRKYDDNNLIVAIAGFESEFRNTAISDLKDFLTSHKINMVLMRANKP